MNPIAGIVRNASRKAREKRARVFRDLFRLDGDTKILDLGSERGSNIHAVLSDTPVRPENVYIADIDPELIREGAETYGFVPVHIKESGDLRFETGFFDIVYCSSVIEHVTIPKDEVWSLRSGRQFKERALERQRRFAREVQRLGRQYFVQTPYRHFPIESHTWLPLVSWLPRPALLPVLRTTNSFWIKKTAPDWYLLNKRQLSEMFEGARILEERFLGITKSIMAVRSDI